MRPAEHRYLETAPRPEHDQRFEPLSVTGPASANQLTLRSSAGRDWVFAARSAADVDLLLPYGGTLNLDADGLRSLEAFCLLAARAGESGNAVRAGVLQISGSSGENPAVFSGEGSLVRCGHPDWMTYSLDPPTLRVVADFCGSHRYSL